ncbi:hypothetical protein [Alteromonas sp. ASW11-130]|uniref:hypothetical protein n=1 Tax=Alteromonas sp. ASW11-130 TaxID=3015775 RepID=UPI00224299E6|nr:hypothetical protein [Alteromonas sp. ASW11-130]MCW8090972.1 hypothetical protein [Alteromonas sp. ASW11-130]
MDTHVVTPDWFSEDKRKRKPKHKRKSLWFWAASLLLHGLLFAIGMIFHSNPVPKIASPTEAIKARLIFPSRAENNLTSGPNEKTDPALAVPPSELLTNPRTKEVPESRIISPIVVTPSTSTTSEKPDDIKPKARLNLSPSSALKSIQSAKHQALLESARRERRQMLVSPKLVDPRKGDDEPTSLIQTHKINCDKGANKVIGFISGITGGTLACSERQSDIDKFIDKYKK